MGRAPCCEKQGLKRGPWSPEEDKLLVDYIQAHGYGTWKSLPRLAGLLRCGKSCRLRWTNYLRPDIKRGAFTPEEDKSIVQLHHILGNKWSTIAANLEGRTDNEIKNYWNTHLKKRQLLLRMPLTTTTTTAADKSNPSPDASTDFFLRIWNSPIGDAFRQPVSTSASSIAAAAPPPPPPHTSPLQSSNITTSNETAAAAAAAAEVTSEEEDSYRDYFNFAAGDDLGLFFFFEGQMESCCYSSPSVFSAELNDDASL